MQDIITEEISNLQTVQDANTVSPNRKSFNTYGRMDLDMSVTENQCKKQEKISVMAKAEMATTDPSKEKRKTAKIRETTSPMHENKTNKNLETTENSKKQKTQQQTNTEVDLNPAQSKYPIAFCGCMHPDPSMQHHPVYPLLFEYATEGCPIDCGMPWTREHLEAAIARGPHISAKEPEAAAA